MPIVSLHGHRQLTARFARSMTAGSLPQSLLLHGEAGVGKQRLALWLAQALLCETEAPACGRCAQCRYTAELTHPDLTWVFPRPRLKDSDASPDEIRQDLGEALRARVEAHGLYSSPPGNEGIYVPTIRMVVRASSVTPAMARRKVIIIGDAERMVSQEGADQAANAFLKLLEEPPANTWVILTSSAPGALLPTIRSRVVACRVSRLTDAEVGEWIAEPDVADALSARNLAGGRTQWIEVAAGAPGRLLNAGATTSATDAARRLIGALSAPGVERTSRIALAQGSAGARGAFTDVLEAVALELRASMRAAVHQGDTQTAQRLGTCIERVEDAKALAQGNVNPQLIASDMLTAFQQALVIPLA
jgi:DNA polymerase-3 subunit delta'